MPAGVRVLTGVSKAMVAGWLVADREVAVAHQRCAAGFKFAVSHCCLIVHLSVVVHCSAWSDLSSRHGQPHCTARDVFEPALRRRSRRASAPPGCVAVAVFPRSSCVAWTFQWTLLHRCTRQVSFKSPPTRHGHVGVCVCLGVAATQTWLLLPTRSSGPAVVFAVCCEVLPVQQWLDWRNYLAKLFEYSIHDYQIVSPNPKGGG